MTIIYKTIVAIGVCSSVFATETNLLVFSYLPSVAAHATYPDSTGHGLNDGEWKTQDIIRFDCDVTLTLDLFVPTAIHQVSVLTATGVNSTMAAATLSGSVDGATWYSLGALQAGSDGRFMATIVCGRMRYLRVTCQKDAACAFQDLTEVIVSGQQFIMQGLKNFTYTPSQPSCPYRADSVSVPKLTDGIFYSAQTGAVQYGPPDTAALTNNAGNPAYAVATNLALVIDFGGGTTTVERLTRISLYAHSPTNGGNWGTESMLVSNSVDGVTWQLIAGQTNFTLLAGDSYGVVRRFDVLLPDSTSRYMTVVAKKPARTATLRQLLTEIEVVGVTGEIGYSAGDVIPYTYTVDQATQVSAENPYAPKLTDFCYEHVTRHALRFYEQTVSVIADFGFPQYVHSGFAYTWGGPTKYTGSADYYGTQRVDCYGSLDGQAWTYFGALTGRVLGQKTNTFTQLPFYRYVKATFVRADSEGDFDVSSQILGELTFYGVPKQAIGALIEVPGVIPFAGFETDPLLDTTKLVMGGSTNGWVFSALDSSNYTGYQMNGSTVSSNVISLTKFFAPEGVQTAVMRGTNVYMETQITIPMDGHYLVRMQAGSLAFDSGKEYAGYNFRVRVDGDDKGLVEVMTLSAYQKQVYVGALAAGTRILRLEAVNSRSCPAGVLIDDLRLFRVPEIDEVPGAAVRKSQSVIMTRTEPVALNYAGKYYIRNLVVDGQSLQHRVYSAENTPLLFSGFGTLLFEDGLTVLIQ